MCVFVRRSEDRINRRMNQYNILVHFSLTILCSLFILHLTPSNQCIPKQRHMETSWHLHLEDFLRRSMSNFRIVDLQFARNVKRWVSWIVNRLKTNIFEGHNSLNTLSSSSRITKPEIRVAWEVYILQSLGLRHTFVSLLTNHALTQKGNM